MLKAIIHTSKIRFKILKINKKISQEMLQPTIISEDFDFIICVLNQRIILLFLSHTYKII
jgi:hypothetical protein